MAEMTSIEAPSAEIEEQLFRGKADSRPSLSGMKRKASRRRYPPQRRQRRRPTATRPSRGAIRKRATKARSSRGRGLMREAASRAPAVAKPTYFSLLKDVEQALKVEHAEGASMQKLKREMERKYGGRAFDVNSCKMLKSAVKRLQNKGRIKKNPHSTLLKFKPPVVPAYNFFGSGGSKGVRVVPIRPGGRQTARAVPIRKHVRSISKVPPMRKHLMARAPTIRKPASVTAKRSSRPMPSYRPPVRRRRGEEYSDTPAGSGTSTASARSAETLETLYSGDAVDSSTRSSS